MRGASLRSSMEQVIAATASMTKSGQIQKGHRVTNGSRTGLVEAVFAGRAKVRWDNQERPEEVRLTRLERVVENNAWVKKRAQVLAHVQQYLRWPEGVEDDMKADILKQGFADTGNGDEVVTTSLGDMEVEDEA